ncbi:hypothetical protein RIF29_16421 [Crotalaria pallida]|uniref:Uncharacterized protein n=1 Tax=Crotalaria pallida TaxID=3830 RepID=A0AAN9FF68_CROPI
MMRTRLLWFSAGLTSTAAVVSHFVWKDLWLARHSLHSDMKLKFDDLDARVSNLESSHQIPTPCPTPNQICFSFLFAILSPDSFIQLLHVS